MRVGRDGPTVGANAERRRVVHLNRGVPVDRVRIKAVLRAAAVWLPTLFLLFVFVPQVWNKWSETGGLEVFLKPSGLENPDPKVTREAGLNGLFPLADGSVLAADSGSRVVVRLDLATKKKTALAAKFNGKRFSSPNDLCQNDQGVTFFTDPPYGLEGINDSKAKELAFNGVFRIAKGAAPGTQAEKLASGQRKPAEIAVGASHIFWVNEGSAVGAAPMPGAAEELVGDGAILRLVKPN